MAPALLKFYIFLDFTREKAIFVKICLLIQSYDIMKRLIFSLTVAFTAALCALSCSQEIERGSLDEREQPRLQEIVLTATIDDNLPETKTQLSADGKFLWSPGDGISLIYGSGSGSYFYSTNTEPAATAQFTGSIYAVTGFDENAPDLKFWGIFPCARENQIVAGQDGNYLASIELPRLQRTGANTWGNEQFPYIGQSRGLAMGFRNVCSGFKFYLENDLIQEIRFRGNNGEILAGGCLVSLENGVPKIESFESNTSREITLYPPRTATGGPGVFEKSVEGNITWYYLAVPPMTFEKGFTFTFLTADGKTGTRTFVSSTTALRNKFISWDKALDRKEKVVWEEPVWGIVGDFNGWSTEGEVMLEQTSTGIWVSPVFNGTAGEYGFKIRKNHEWDVNYGGYFQSFGTPFAAVQDGPNLMQGETNDLNVRVTFDMTDPFNPMITIDEAAYWSVIGGFNSWDDDLAMTETSLGIWESPEFTTDRQGFKVRFNKNWELNYGGTFTAYGSPIQGIVNGDSIMWDIEDSKTVKVQLDVTDPDNPLITVFEVVPPDTWSVIGAFSYWSTDVEMYESSPGVWVSEPFITPGGNGNGFKIRKNHSWNYVDYGGSFSGFAIPFAAVVSGDNIVVGETGKDYSISVTLDLTDSANPRITVTNNADGWCIIGSFNEWNADIVMEETQSGKWLGHLSNVAAGTEFKLRLNHNWENNLGVDAEGGVSTVSSGIPFGLAANGANIRVDTAGSYDVLLDMTGSSPVATVTLVP